MPKVLLLMDNPMIPTGYASTCRLTAKELKKRGWDVYAMAFNGGQQNGPSGEPVFDFLGIKIVRNDALARKGDNIYGDAEAIKKAYAEVQPDILFFHNDSYRYSYIKELPEEILERSVFWLPFEGDNPDIPGVDIFGKCAAIKFVTKHALDLHVPHLKDKNIGYIPHAVDMDHMRPFVGDKTALKASKQLGVDNKFLVIRIDRHQPRKYWDLTLQAFARFAKDKDDVFLLCKCNPRDVTMWDEGKQEGQNLETMAKDLGIDKKIKFDDFFFDVSYMPNAFYWPADVFLTTTSGEGFGLGPVESMACACPLIYPDTPVLPEIVGEGGMMCKRKGREWYSKMSVWHNIVDTDDVVAKLQWAYDDWKKGGKELQKIGAKAREIAEAKYSPKVVYDQWHEAMIEVLEKRDLVSIITVLYNVSGKEQIYAEDGIDKLRQTMEQYVKHPYEWIIIDNNSPNKEETASWLAEAAKKNPRIKPMYLTINRGFAGANNVGIKAARGKYILFMNSDSEAIPPQKHGFTKDFIRLMVDKIYSDPKIGLVGMELWSRDDILQGATFPYFCCAMASRPCLDAIRLPNGEWFDEAFWPAYYEDADLTIRIRMKGFKVVSDHSLPFWHKSGGCNKHMITDGAKNDKMPFLRIALERLQREGKMQMDYGRKEGEIAANGMQGLIKGNIAYLNSKWGPSARSKIRVVWDTRIGDGVGFSQIAEGLIPELDKLGFDVYVNDWMNGSNVENSAIRKLIEKTRKVKESGDDLREAIHIVCWLMESFFDIDAEYKVGIAFCESTKVRESYLHSCNGMDRILTFSEFCRGVQKDSGFRPPIHVISPGVAKEYINYHERKVDSPFKFLCVGVSQERKDTYRLVQAFCEAFPKGADHPPECEPGFPIKCDDIQLILKSNNFGALSWVHQVPSDGGLPYSKRANIKTMFTGQDKRAERPDLTMAEMYDLYCQANALVHPSHGEGIGMPILEAAATGCPTIFTNWSSPSEYLSEWNSYPISLSPYPGTMFTKAYNGAPGDNGNWANCHIGHLKFLMYHVIRNYAEAKEKGRRAHDTIKKQYTWEESAKQLWPLLMEWEEHRKSKPKTDTFDPLTFVKPKLEQVKKGDRILIDVATRDRHPYLGVLIVSLLAQTFKDWDIIIQIDDADESVLQNHLIQSLLKRCEYEGHGWRMIRSQRQGPHMAHQRSLQMAIDDPRYKYKLICRIDDDIYVRPNYLETLYKPFLEDKNCEVGAVAGIYPDPKRPDQAQVAPKNWESDINYAGKIDHNVPWPYVCFYPPGTKPREMEHLYSSFLYRVEIAKAIGGYCKLLSQIGHREESDFSYRFFLSGYRLLLHPDAVGFHFQAQGGIRSHDIKEKEALAASDHKISSRRLEKWKKRYAEKLGRQAQQKTAVIEEAKGKTSNKVACVITGGKNPETVNKAVQRFSEIADAVFVWCEVPDKSLIKGNKLVDIANRPDEAVRLMQKTLESDYSFVLNVSDKMHFMSSPRGLLSDRYDDYVFEVYQTYDTGKPGYIGPECRNMCLIGRRGKLGKEANLEKVLYSDIVVVEDEKLTPKEGKSSLGWPLLDISDIAKANWTKICLYQYPNGKCDPPLQIEVKADPLVSIIIPTPGRKDLLNQCLNSIYAYTTTPFEVVIVDNGSEDGTPQMLEAQCKTRPNIVVHRSQTNLGYQKGINLGISKSRGKYLLLFNDDAWIEKPEPDGRDWLRVLIDELDSEPKVGLVGPHGGESPALKKFLLYFWCVMMKRSTYDDVGPFDDVTFRNYGGDDDYCERLRAKGYAIKQKYLCLRHLMTCVPEEIKQKELAESRLKLRNKYKMGG